MRKRSYWEQRLNMTSTQLEEYLAHLGLSLAPEAKTLPKDSIRRIRKDLPVNVESKDLLDRSQAGSTIRSERASSDALPQPPDQWPTIGREAAVILPSTEELLTIHHKLVIDSLSTDDPIDPPGMRDENLLESALFRPRTSLAGVEKYPTIEMSCAALTHSLVSNHPFYNGNKRTVSETSRIMLLRSSTDKSATNATYSNSL